MIALARHAGSAGRHAPLLLAGDEAQTVRATDFEWAWLNDMLHDSMGAPQEFKLPVNLRSPRRIADLVNRAWDLYDHLHKQDRPSGSGYAEIDDDSPDEVLYAAVRESDLPELLTDFSAREGLALIAFEKAGIPEKALAAVLSPAEAKGLDFHSVCLLNGGALLRRISDPRAGGPAGTLARRLAIDQLRVALSRPTERLIWVDVAPDPATVREVRRIAARAGRDYAASPMTLEALLATPGGRRAGCRGANPALPEGRTAIRGCKARSRVVARAAGGGADRTVGRDGAGSDGAPHGISYALRSLLSACLPGQDALG